MKHVLDARQVDALLAREELDDANPSDIVFRIAPAVGGRPLRLDQVLALVNHQGAGVQVEDLAGDAGREYRPGAIAAVHFRFPISPHTRSIPKPAHRHNFIPKISLIACLRKPPVPQSSSAGYAA